MNAKGYMSAKVSTSFGLIAGANDGWMFKGAQSKETKVALF
jgi:hypothetical protein